MPDYSKSKIYQVISSQCEQVYIGSTTIGLAQRLAQHRSSYKQFKAGKTTNCTSYQLLDYDDVKIELIEDFPCERREQLLKREGELIRERNCVNQKVSGRTHKEASKIYKEKNKESMKLLFKQWYESNKERQKKYRDLNTERIQSYRDSHKEKNRAYQKAYRERKKAERLTSQSPPEQNLSSLNSEAHD